MPQDPLLIGVDGGATEAKAHAVDCDDLRAADSFRLRNEAAGRVYERLAGFQPLPVPEQLAQRDAGRIELTPAEREQGRVWVAAAADAIVDVARQCGAGNGAKRVLIGVGMPGLKAPDRRGINVINNGPRIPDYLDQLERAVAAAGVQLAAPVAALGSDADYCGLGEEYAADGLFRDVQHAYYMGGGTGIADALKLRGRLVPLDAAKGWMQKSWQMVSALGPPFEKLVSARSLNAVYHGLREQGTGNREQAGSGDRGSGIGERGSGSGDQGSEIGNRSARQPSGRSGFPERDAAAGDPVALAWMHAAALLLAELVFERIWTIRNGAAAAPHRGDAYALLDGNHEYRGVLLERVIIGQRIGGIYGDSACRPLFGEHVDACLATMLARSGDTQLADQLVEAGRLRPGFVVASRLRAAPALGAAVAAAQALAARS